MPILARMKRNAAVRTGNKALRADAVQSATCAYLAALTLAGLLLRSAFGIHWLDQVAALVAVPILIVEARRAREGQACGCC
jgi:divalent metal cation (Fe/Co/Zn/Cd) transporter